MIPAVYTDVVNVTRRAAQSTVARDVLNNPSFGTPSLWGQANGYVYQNIKVRIAFSGKPLAFTPKGELVKPQATLYFDKKYTILPMDRIITVNCPGYAAGIEYVVTEVYPSMYGHGIVDHMEGKVELPT